MLDNDPLWYKDAVIYELHVRAFADSVGTGVGDFRGLTGKLDYLEDLGVTAVWLLPFYPSPLKDDGYDIASYTDVHPQYGRLPDFKEFLDGAHRRGIRVITELVINHTSDQHPWFQRARRAGPGTPERDFYVWSDTPEKYKLARIIFKDFEPSNWTYDHVAKAYYWHRFYSHQPDLNFDNPAVWQALFPVLDFWLEMGVDGMRLDAIPYLYEREGTNCENLPETHQFLKALRRHLDDHFPGRMFLAEANQWPEDSVAYFGTGDECHMAFHFPVMPRLFMALHQEDRFPILDILAQTPAIPESCQWCMFLRNHDELTLEMVTDEERDYMYRAYAEDRTARINLGIRRRLAPLLRNDRRRIELMNALLFSLPGTPVIYYGDEIGMGDNIYLGDRNGVRTPMQWSPDRNAGFSRANPQQLYLPVIIDPEYHYEAINVESQQNNPSSLLWWTKRLINLRKRYRAFGRGSIEFLQPANRKVLAFLRQYDEERILVVANLSRFVQYVELDLGRFRGQALEELFGRSLFPPVGERAYPLTLGPHGFYWFTLTAPSPVRLNEPAVELPVLRIRERPDELFENSNRDRLEMLLPAHLQRRWPGGVPAPVTAAQVQDVVPFELGGFRVWLLVVKLEFRSGIPEKLMLPLTIVPPEQASQLLEPAALAGLALVRQQVQRPNDEGQKKPGEGPGAPSSFVLAEQEWVLIDALVVPAYCRALIERLAQGGTYRLAEGDVVLVPLPGLAELAQPLPGEPAPMLARSERNNVTITFGTRLIYKSFRRMEEGVSPDVEVGKLLAENQLFTDLSPIVGHVEYRRRKRRGEPSTLAVLHRYIPNEGHAWQYTLDQLSSFFERVAALTPEQARLPLEVGGAAPLDALSELMGGYAGLARQLGTRTAELHRALASLGEQPSLAPEPITRLYQRSLYQSMRNLAGQLCSRLERDAAGFPEATRLSAERVAARQPDLLEHCRALLQVELTGQRIRIHGNYHLGELLYTGNRFVLVDFEGEAGRPLGERRVKRSPLRDVASMIRSFDYAVSSVLTGLASGRGRPPGLIRAEDRPVLEAWGKAWVERVVREFVSAYSEAVPPGLLPETVEGRRVLLDVLLLEKAMHEADAELTFRPDWAVLPLRAILRQLDGERHLNPWLG